jgi:hypothetical protein
MAEIRGRAWPRNGRHGIMGAMLPRAILRAAALAIALGAPAEAWAQREPPPSSSGLKMAQDFVEEGRALAQRGQWAEALVRFQRAASVSTRTSPQIAFYVGSAESHVGKLVAAQVDLRRAIDLARTAGNTRVLDAAQAELPELEARTPTVSITVKGAAAPTGLAIDGAALGVAALGAPVPLDPGDHVIVVELPSGRVSKSVTLVERQRATLAIDAPEAAPTAGMGSAAGASPSDASSSAAARSTAGGEAGEHAAGTRKTLAVVALAAGGASLVAAGVFYGLSRSAYSPVSDACPSSPCTVPSGSPLPSEYQDAQTKQTVSIVLAGAGAAVAATGLVLLLTGGTGAAAPAQPATSARLVPWLGAGSAGAAVGGAF